MFKQRWRFLVLAALFGTPVIILITLGCYYLWESGASFWVWWPLSGCIAVGYFLAWRWQRSSRLLPEEPPVPLHWTERDLAAWKLVEARAKHVLSTVHPDQLTAFPIYTQTAQDLALELAKFYHPEVSDPVGALTIPEILTVIELATHDLAEMVDQYLPGGHLLTINDMRRFKQMADWYPTISNITWAVSSIFNPLSTAIRYLAARGGMSIPWQLLQQNVLGWFFTAYVHRLGSYLIELNSGRLSVGVKRYLDLQKTHGPAETEPVGRGGEQDPAEAIRAVRFVLVGQAKVGKSSLINALLGEEQAIADVLPATAGVTQYELQPPGIGTRLHLLDTAGYAVTGPRADQRRATEQAAQNADLVLLVLHARNPARQADLDLLEGLKRFFLSQPALRRPAILAVLTHIDLLSPSLEWQPPYDWQDPKRPKEQEIRDAVDAVREQLGSYLEGVIPVCTAPGKIYGVQEWLLPALTGLLDQAHAVAFLRCLKAEKDTGKVRKVFQQLSTVFQGMVQSIGNAIRSRTEAKKERDSRRDQPTNAPTPRV